MASTCRFADAAPSDIRAKAGAVAVIMPTYNGLSRGYLSDALASVLAQIVRPAETIVVDDGSTDGTAEASVQWSRRSGVRVLRLPRNVGLAEARNAGVRATTAPLIAFLDDDDEWMPHKLLRQIEALERQRCDLVFSPVLRIDSKGKALAASQPILGDSLYWPGILFCDPIPTPSAVLVRRSALLEVGGFCKDLRFAEDWDLWARIARRSAVALVAEPLARYRVHDQQMGAGKAPVWVRQQTMVALEHMTRDLLPEQRDLVLNAYGYGGAWRALASLKLRAAWELATRANGRVDWSLFLRKGVIGAVTRLLPRRSASINQCELRRLVGTFTNLNK
jgi:hypothetical protein